MKIHIDAKILLMATVCSGWLGCDRLPESISGRPNLNAPQLSPVGPTGTSEQATSALDLPSLSINSSPFVTVASTQELTNEASSPVVPSGGLEDGSPIDASTFNSSDPNAGLQVPAAESFVPSANGKIYIPSATLRFVDDREVVAQADGLITMLDADEGDWLKADALMIQLDDRLANSELEVTKKEYEAAVEKAKDDSEIQYSKASYEVAQEDYKIAKLVDDKGAGTATELMKKWLEFKRADLAITVAEVKNKQDLSAASVAQAKQGAAQVQVQLRKIIAPFDGIVAQKKKEKNDWVRAGDVIFRLVSMEELRVVGQVRVAQLSAAPHELLGAPATINIELFPGRIERVTAKVGFVSPVMESSGSYKIWLQIPNIKSSDQWIFREGMPATIEISTK